MDIINRQKAKKNGLMYYYTGKLCVRGHNSVRMVKGGACRECKNFLSSIEREQNREKYRKYYRERAKKKYSSSKRRESYQKNIVSEMLIAAKNRANKKNFDFTIEKDDVIIPKECPVLGIPIIIGDKNGAPTLDRKDNNLGYIKGNIFVISKRANRLKSDSTLDELEKIITYMRN